MKKTITFVITITAICAVLSGVFYALNKSGRENRISSALEKVILPVQSLLSRAENVFYNIKNKDVYIEENKKLKNENGRLRYEVRQFENIKKENLRLRGLLELSQNNKEFNMTAAEVVGKSRSNGNLVLKINKGKLDGIKINDTAVLNYTLIGRVYTVGENWAKIIPVISPESSVGAVSCESDVSAVADGQAEISKEGKLLLSYISEKEKIITGEQIETSGGESLFPKGLLIGTVSEVLKNSAIIDTNIDFNGLSEVMIIKRGQD